MPAFMCIAMYNHYMEIILCSLTGNQALLAMKPTGTVFPGSPGALAAPQSLDYRKYLVLSLGTGTPKTEKKYDAKMASKWGIIGWLYKDGHSPLVDAFTFASGDMVDLHMSLIFRSISCEHNYLRIQVRISMDIYTISTVMTSDRYMVRT